MNKKQIIEAIKEERIERIERYNEKYIFPLFAIIMIIGAISVFLLIGYTFGKDAGYNEGWDDVNQGIINILNIYDTVNLFWANGTEVGLRLEKYQEPNLYSYLNWDMNVSGESK